MCWTTTTGKGSMVKYLISNLVGDSGPFRRAWSGSGSLQLTLTQSGPYSGRLLIYLLLLLL